jgi:hypothetical protein
LTRVCKNTGYENNRSADYSLSRNCPISDCIDQKGVIKKAFTELEPSTKSEKRKEKRAPRRRMSIREIDEGKEDVHGGVHGVINLGSTVFWLLDYRVDLQSSAIS